MLGAGSVKTDCSFWLLRTTAGDDRAAHGDADVLAGVLLVVTPWMLSVGCVRLRCPTVRDGSPRVRGPDAPRASHAAGAPAGARVSGGGAGRATSKRLRERPEDGQGHNCGDDHEQRCHVRRGRNRAAGRRDLEDLGNRGHDLLHRPARRRALRRALCRECRHESAHPRLHRQDDHEPPRPVG